MGNGVRVFCVCGKVWEMKRVPLVRGRREGGEEGEVLASDLLGVMNHAVVEEKGRGYR